MADHAHEKTETAAAQHHHAEHHHAPAAPVADFDQAELKFFDRDDVSAGANIGKMLAIIFVYTLIATGIVGWWTFRSILH